MKHADVKFHTGYYNVAENSSYHKMAECLSDVVYDDLENEYDDRADCPYTCALDFLQGSCQLFSLALHQEFGFNAFEIWRGKGFHCFCTSTYKERTVYIDVRGTTTDFDEFLAGTAFIMPDYDKIIPQDLKRDAKLEGEWDDVGYLFAQRLIREHPEYYNIVNP